MSVLTAYQSTFDAPEEENFQFMKNMCIKGLKAKGVYDNEWHQKHLEEELKIIQECNLENFFLRTS